MRYGYDGPAPLITRKEAIAVRAHMIRYLIDGPATAGKDGLPVIMYLCGQVKLHRAIRKLTEFIGDGDDSVAANSLQTQKRRKPAHRRAL